MIEYKKSKEYQAKKKAPFRQWKKEKEEQILKKFGYQKYKIVEGSGSVYSIKVFTRLNRFIKMKRNCIGLTLNGIRTEVDRCLV
jgi:hypothetical protein